MRKDLIEELRQNTLMAQLTKKAGEAGERMRQVNEQVEKYLGAFEEASLITSKRGKSFTTLNMTTPHPHEKYQDIWSEVNAEIRKRLEDRGFKVQGAGSKEHPELVVSW